MHVHNTFPSFSPAIFRALPPGLPRVLTLHNARLFCPAAVPLRDGRVCTECLDRRSVLPSLLHACYRQSRLATLPLAASSWLHRAMGTWERHLDAFVLLTAYQRELLVGAGLPADRAHVKPNFYPGDPRPVPWAEREERVVFAGRLDATKGVRTLVEAWLGWDEAPELQVVGGGPLEPPLRALAAASARIRLLGQRSPSETEALIARARLLVLPSPAFEGFPMVIREAFAFGTPVAVSDIPSLAGVVEAGVSGVRFTAGDPARLREVVRAAWNEAGLLERLSGGARAAFDRHYSEAGEPPEAARDL